MTKSNMGKKGFISPDSTEGSQDRNLEAETGVEAMEECCLPACSPGLTPPALSKHVGSPPQEWYHIYGLGPATPITS